jgi:enoyl-CoA hydratase/carnithine racemase
VDAVLLARDGVIATVALNNPGRQNTPDKRMWAELRDTMQALGRDVSLGCVVIRGAGEHAFAAGADVSEFARERAGCEQARRYGELIDDALQAVACCTHPTVALIHGACIGGGLDIAARCDLRICGESSRFGVAVNRLGLTLSYGELEGLLALAGRAVTLEMLLEGRVFDAREAYEKGLVNRVVADSQVEDEAYAAARRIAAGAPLVARRHKQYIERLAPLFDVSAAERNEAYACFDTADYHEGVAAFLAGRKPVFHGT